MFDVRVGEAERRLSRTALVDEVRAGTVPGEAACRVPSSLATAAGSGCAA